MLQTLSSHSKSTHTLTQINICNFLVYRVFFHLIFGTLVFYAIKAASLSFDVPVFLLLVVGCLTICDIFVFVSLHFHVLWVLCVHWFGWVKMFQINVIFIYRNDPLVWLLLIFDVLPLYLLVCPCIHCTHTENIPPVSVQLKSHLHLPEKKMGIEKRQNSW